MPHDRNGEVLKVGDTVNLKCTVSSIYNDAKTCDLVIIPVISQSEHEHEVFPITCTARQVEKQSN